nr:Band 7 protein domain containing protein [Haemonchus contortus]
MRRIHTLQSEDQSAHGSSIDLDFSLPPHEFDDEDSGPSSPPVIDRNLLFVPDIHELSLDKGEKPPHKRDVIEKIPMRARSQSWLIRTRHLLHDESRRTSPLISHMMLFFSILLFFMSLPWSLLFCFKVIKEYQRAVIFRLGRLIRGGTKGPGLFFVLPCIDTCKIVDLRVLSFDVPPQEILSRDSVTVSVEAVIYFRVSNPVISVTNVNDAQFSTRLLAQTTLRNVLGTKTLSEMLSERDAIASITEKVLDEGTDPWGVKVERVEIKDIRLPHMLMRSMAAEAEAVRRARAAVIHAEGEKNASRWMSEAAEIISGNKIGVQLRYLQTLHSIASQRNNTIVIPFPIEVARKLIKKFGHVGSYKTSAAIA